MGVHGSFPKRKSQQKLNEKAKAKKSRTSVSKSRKKWGTENVVITITESDNRDDALIINISKVFTTRNEKDNFEEDKITAKVENENKNKFPKKK